MDNSTRRSGLLFVWTNADPNFEEDFNRWYDREHVEERIAIPGFVVGTRYIAAEASRKYLGLYRTESLDVFSTPAYRQAFEHQTPWSVVNLGRMQDTVRRVCTIASETGMGGGAWLAVLRLGRSATPADLQTLAEVGATLQAMDGVIATRVLDPDPALSTPLPGEDPERRILDPILLIEGTSEPVVVDAARIAAKEARATNSDVGIMRMMWRLHLSEIPSRQKGA
jgi:hypothetical protein